GGQRGHGIAGARIPRPVPVVLRPLQGPAPMTDPAPATAPTAPESRLSNRLGVGFMRLLAHLPLPCVRALGWLLGRVLHAVAARRRRIAQTNWAACFPDHSEAERDAAVRRH